MRLLIGSDLSQASYQVIKLLRDCQLNDFGEVILAHIIELDPYTAGGSFPMLEEEDKKILDAYAEDIKKTGIKVKVEVREGNVVEQLNAIAKENDVDMISVTNIGKGLTDNLLGSTAEKLASQTKLPVLIEKVIVDKEKYCRASEGHIFRNVVCAIDFSENSKKAALYSSKLPGLKEFTLVNVSSEDTIQVAESEIKGLIKQEGLEAKAALLIGNPTGEILKFIEENNVSCISMGLCGHSGIQRMLWGSVSAEIAKNSKIPVLIIP